jgi:tellurite resistance protein TerB
MPAASEGTHMPLWNQLRNQTQSMQQTLVAKKKDFQSGAFRDATMAMCALIAAADGSIDAEERRKVASLISQNEVLQNFPADQLQQLFNDYADKLARDFDFGKVSVLQEIAKVKKKQDEARAVIQIGIIIGGADGTFDEAEKKMVRDACHAVNLPPAEFDL